MNVRHAARLLGGDAYGAYVLCPGPGHSRKDRSLKVSFDPQAPDGFRVHSFAGDDWRECRDHVRALLSPSTSTAPMARPTRLIIPKASQASSDAARTARAMDLWGEALAPGKTVVETYLAERGLALPADAAGAAIRFHPACPFRLKDDTTVRLPAMIGLMRYIITDEPCGIHRTALKPDGSGKAEMPDGTGAKKMLGRAKGAVVKLSAEENVTDGLGITEGIETALTILCGGWRPVWAALSAGAIADFPVLPGIERLTIFADADLIGLGAARECQTRWRAAGQECPIVTPRRDGADWNDWRTAA